MKVVFFGSSRLTVPILSALNNNYQVVLVVTTEQGSQEPIKFFCQTHKINCISVRKQGDLIANYDIKRSSADIGIVADFGVIIPQPILDVFPKGVVNVHPSLLPKYRGPTPVQSALLNGDLNTGVSIILLDNLVDHGPMFLQKIFQINPIDNTKSLYEKLFKEGATMLLEVLQKYEHNAIAPTPQNHSQATFTKPLTKEDGFINLGELKAENWKTKIEPMVRAYYPWPGVWIKAKINSSGTEKIIKLLPGQKIQVEGGREMAYKDFINGYPLADKALMDFLKGSVTND